MGQRHRIALIAASLIVAACGGGGGGMGNGPSTTPSTATVSLSGVAAKGPMANADVGVYAVDAGGSIAATPLAGTVTDKDGKYTLNFSGTPGQPYVVKVSAKADGSTTEADEVSAKAVALPAGFAMRTLVVPASTGALSISSNITPFSELAAAAAAKAAGGITAANAAQAMSTVNQLLGLDATKVAVVPTATAGASADEKKLAVLLTAVSHMANHGALGCAGGDVGTATRCVVDTMGAAASTRSLKLSTAGTDVSAALSGAIGTVLNTPALAGAVDSALLTTAVTNLGCSANCAAAPVGTPPASDPTANAITAAKLMFGQIKSDWQAMFSDDGVTSLSTGAANAEAFKFASAMADIEQAVTTLQRDTETVTRGIDLYTAYKAGASTTTIFNIGIGQVPNDNPGRFIGLGTSSCGLYTDASATTLATSPANANVIGCSAYYYASATPIPGGWRYTYWRHGFLVTPNGDGSYGWQSRARRTVNNCTPTCVRVANDNLQLDTAGNERVFTGTATPTLAGPHVAAVVATGQLPAGFEPGGTALANDSTEIGFDATRSVDAASGDTISLTINRATFVSKDSAGATLSSVTIKQGQAQAVPVSHDSQGNIVAPTSPNAVGPAGYELVTLSLDIVSASPGASTEGLFTAADPAWDKSLTLIAPTKLSLQARLTTTTGGVNTDFVTGTLTAATSGFTAYDATQPLSATNGYGANLSFVGGITAPSRPVLEISAGFAGRAGSAGQSVSLQYRTLVNGLPRSVVNITATPASATVGSPARFVLSETTADLTMRWADGDAIIKLMSGGGTLEVGSYDTRTQVITFKDGTLMSLDLGL